MLPFALKALVVGVLFGAGLALLLTAAHRALWLTEQSGRVAVLLLTYTATVAMDGNGFVASFVCGVTFRYVHRLAKAREAGSSLNLRVRGLGDLAQEFVRSGTPGSIWACRW